VIRVKALTKSRSLAAVIAAAGVAILLLADPARVAVLGAVALLGLALLVRATGRSAGGPPAQRG
jgi:hypothetical protein